MKIKICGMKYRDNIIDVAQLHPEYLGFIFYNKSKRNFEGEIPPLPIGIKKTGVFVNAKLEEVLKTVKEYDLDAVQLHGDESPQFCQSLSDIEVIKVFSVDDSFDFSVVFPYEKVCDYFLFDTKGKKKGGNGIVFNWKLLQNYPSKMPFFLSGGIGKDELINLKSFMQSEASTYCYAIDINSKFEIEQGLKDIEKLKEFKQNLEKG